MNSEKSHRSRSRAKESLHSRRSRSRRNESRDSSRSKSRHKGDRHKHRSTSHHRDKKYQVSQRSASSSSREASPTSKQQQVAKNDLCVRGPDIYTNVLGPTPDETLLVGLQTFLGFCTGRSGENSQQPGIESHHEPAIEDNPYSEGEEELSSATHHELDITETRSEPLSDDLPQNLDQSDLRDIEETEIGNITESQFVGHSSLKNYPTNQTFSKVEAQTSSEGFDKPITIDTEVQSPSVSTISKESQTEDQNYSDKSLDTSELSVITGEMLNSEGSSQTDYPSQEHRTSQTKAEKNPKTNCICKVLAEESTSEPSMQKNHCTCPACCNKRRSKITKRSKPGVGSSNSRYRCLCNSPSTPVATSKGHSSSEMSYSTEEDDNVVVKNDQMGIVKYAITKITKFCNYTTFEIMKSTKKKPKVMPSTVEGVFVLKNNK